MKKFYYVFAEGGNKPTKRHDTYELALAEAERLTLSGEFFRAYVCEAQAVVKRAVVVENVYGKGNV